MKPRHVVVSTLLLALALPAAASEGPDPRAALAGLGELIHQALAEQKIPGASVAVVVGDEVVLLEGYGLRDIERNLPMTPDTMLPIASVTKQFTVAALGTLARQGKLDWDAPVRDYLPELRLHDDYATLRATPRDLVTHRVGLPRHDWAWYGSSSTREELYGRLRHFPFSADIRTRYQYNNFMYMTAGYLAGRLAGTSYEEHVAATLLEPLDMSRTHYSLAAMTADPDHATGYELGNDRELSPRAFTSAEAMAPTGAMNSTARDLARWMRMMLAGGLLDGERILQQSDVAAMMQPMMPVGPSLFPEFGFRSYGMGLSVQNYRGHEVASHGGNLPGAATMLVMAPRERIGVAVLTNRSAARLRDGLPYEILDRLLGLPSADLVARFARLEQQAFEGEDAAREAGATVRRLGTSPSHELAEFAGSYLEPGYGTIDIALAGGTLAITYNGFTAPLEHWHYDVFRVPEDRTSELDRLRVQFQSDFEGEVSSLVVPLEPNVAPAHFVKQPPPEMTDPAFLARFVGTYEVTGIPRQIVLREDGVLQYVVLGTVYHLEPVRGALFRVQEVTGTSIEFLADEAGEIDRMAIHGARSVVGPKQR